MLFPAASEAMGFISDQQCAVMFCDCNNSSRDKHFLKEIALEMNRSDGFTAPFPVTTFMLTAFSSAKFPLFKTHWGIKRKRKIILTWTLIKIMSIFHLFPLAKTITF